jgi:ADP-ribosylglycohydrolase
VVELHGPAFTWENVADWWMSRIPISNICTAESQAILNWMNRTARWGSNGTPRTAATPAFCRRNRNPYREWIGAQIRSDGWAWCAAGKPELAAEFAYRDACWTHERNGIYGEMLFAAMQAAAFVESDPLKLVEIGLSEIPRDCRLARIVRQTLAICAQATDWEAAMEQVEAICNAHSKGLMSAVHTINNAAICVVSLIYGRMDTVNAVTISVMAGLDTDCNGATVGSIVGAAAGKKRFKDDLAGRLNDTIKPNMIGFQEVTMADLAKRTAVQWRRCDAYWDERHGRATATLQAAGAVAG